MEISCHQTGTISDRSWRISLTCEGAKRHTDLHDPFKIEAEEKLIQWYLEDFAVKPFAKYRAAAASAELRRYGNSLWQQLGITTGNKTPSTVNLKILLYRGSRDIDRIHWEVLETIQGLPFNIIVHRVIINDTFQHQLSASNSPSIRDGIFRILIVSARSNTRPDVPYRLTSLPLLQTLKGNPKVEMEFVHTGTFEEFKETLSQKPVSRKAHLVHFDLHGRIDKKKGPVLEFADSNLAHRTSHTASSVAKVLHENGVQWAVLCACRTAKATSTFNHLAIEFLENGIKGIFAMRYEIKATAAKIITSSFYHALCQEGKTFVEAAYTARRALQENPSRPAHFGEMVDIQDSLVPAVYSVDGENFRLACEELLPEIIGREDDIRQLSRIMRREKSFLVAFGDIGSGKSLLLKHLAWWWRESGLFRRVIYLNVSLFSTTPNEDIPVGLMAVGRGFWQSILGDSTIQPKSLDAVSYLTQAMEAAKDQDCIVLLDGVDETYKYPSKSDDTADEWLSFFNITKNLSATGFKLVVGTSSRSLVSDEDASSSVFEISREMTTLDARKFITSSQMQPQTSGPSKDSPDTHLLRVFEVLQYNRTVLKTLSGQLEGKFHGLEAILSWDIGLDRDAPKGAMFCYISEKAEMFRSLDLNDSQGLGRTHHLMITIMKHLVRHGRYRDIWALLSIGVWVDVLPHPDGIADIFQGENFALKMAAPLFKEMVDIVPDVNLVVFPLPFELWSMLNNVTLLDNDQSSYATEEMVESLRYVVQLLVAARLLTGRTEVLIDGKQGYRLHPALTIWIRRILRTQVCFGIRCGLFVCMEQRAGQMLELNDDIPITQEKTSILSPSFPFIEREKWNLMAAVAGMHQYSHLLREAAPSNFAADSQTFAWQTFNALAPICALTEDFCTWFLTHVALKYLEIREPLIPESLDDPLPDPLGPLLLLLNWTVMMLQRYRLEEEMKVPLRLRRMILRRLKAMRIAGVGAEELSDRNVVTHEIRGWLNEAWITVRLPDSTQADMDPIVEMITISSKQLGDTAWNMRIQWMIDQNKQGLINEIQDFTSIEDTLKSIREGAGQDSSELGGERAGQTLILEFVLDTIKYFNGQDETVSSPAQFTWMFDMIQFMEKIEFFRSLPPWYITEVRDIFAHLRRGNIPLAMAAAERGLYSAESDGHVLVAANFRQVCHRIGEMDTAGEYDAVQTQIARIGPNSSELLRGILNSLASHDTPSAYLEANLAYIQMNVSLKLMPIFQDFLSPHMQSLVQSSPERNVAFEGLERLVALLEPYQSARLEDRREWVCLVQAILDLTAELADQTGPSQREWMVKAMQMFPGSGGNAGTRGNFDVGRQN
ncbi:hypothetical protein N7466_005979 [Penicillium verhagenii]|uniref:uncharacterized protein n=1 Tax=Penicillium verhagenii TaxID=1562060 RepID=UPI00254520B0|nr:uncharacterized protein N7466_005979 [Penicillium verhagenii]KAJ5930486.1 hypothetical protein N7466_005979 [Penicillium verhagenii]